MQSVLQQQTLSDQQQHTRRLPDHSQDGTRGRRRTSPLLDARTIRFDPCSGLRYYCMLLCANSVAQSGRPTLVLHNRWSDRAAEGSIAAWCGRRGSIGDVGGVLGAMVGVRESPIAQIGGRHLPAPLPRSDPVAQPTRSDWRSARP